AFVSTGALGRGALGPFDSTRFGIMTAGVYMRGILALCSTRTGRFKVTPKEGIDEGGLRVVRKLALVSALAVLLLAAWLFRLAAAAGVVSTTRMPELALVVTLALGVWELGCIAAVVAPLARRRQSRRHYRSPVDLAARIGSTHIRVHLVDLSPEGLAFES